MAYSLRGRHHIDAWFVENDAAACAAMAIWVQALVVDPLLVASGAFRQARTARRFYWSHVPGTNSIVTYVVMDVPVRIVTILSVIPGPAP